MSLTYQVTFAAFTDVVTEKLAVGLRPALIWVHAGLPVHVVGDVIENAAMRGANELPGSLITALWREVPFPSRRSRW